MMDVPVKYQMCGHLLCKPCSEERGNTCPSCRLPSRASEIKADNFTHNLIKAWKIIAQVVGYESGGHAQEEPVPQVASEEMSSHQVSPLGTEDEHSAEKKKETPEDKLNSSTAAASKQSSDGGQVGSKMKKPQGRPRRAVSSDRKAGDVSTASEGDGTPRPRPRAGRKTSESRGVGTPRDSSVGRAPAASTPKKDAEKRNAKGETLLHVACIKGNVKQVKELLELGATPNTKDNAGWTPLHEVSSAGATELVALLLGAGALPSVPGPDNMTPLHDAVLNQSHDVVRLLVAHGADVNARSSAGLTPLQSTDDASVLALLREPPSSAVPSEARLLDSPPAVPGKVVLLPCGLDPAREAQLRDMAAQLGVKLCASLTASVTHVIVPENENDVCPVTMVTLTAILQGKWIVNFNWVAQSLAAGQLLPCSQFEVKGTTEHPASGAPRRSRINTQLLRPYLLNGCHVYLVPQRGPYSAGQVQLDRAELAALVVAGGGVVLGREPDPEGISLSQRTVPYHATPGSPLACCAHYLLYQPGGSGEPRLKYNMAHVKSLPVGWLLASVQCFSLVPPGC
ncbi:BRCA1-associated RING domain protein 1-like isoform X2 [Bacillus rossius redtenbacheri]